LTGPLDPAIRQLVNLKYLFLSNNKLNGIFPESITTLKNLITLSIQHNQVTGTITKQLNDMSALQVLRLDYNEFTQTQFECSQKLQVCDISHNKFGSFYRRNQ
jgi:Leucine-rich repeat (LRR) protein